MKTVNQWRWLIASLIGFLLFISFFFSLIYLSNTKNFTLTTPVYFFLVVLIGLISSGFLSGAMKSVSKFQGNSQSGSLYLAGPAVIFFLVIYLGYKYRPDPVEKKSLAVSVLVKDAGDSTEIFTEGIVSIRAGDFNASEKINSYGKVFFTGINPQYRGKEIDLNTQIPNYRPSKESFVLDGEDGLTNITLFMVKKTHSIYVTGRVIKLPGRVGIGNANVEFQGVNKTFVTDSTGKFSVTLPFESGHSARVIVTRNSHEIYNSLRTISDNDFLSIPVDD